MRGKSCCQIPRCVVCGTLIMSLVGVSSAPPVAQNRGSLKAKENPLLIGQRDINRHQINFYSLKKEAAIGRRISSEFERSARLITDPVITEYINRIGQNIVLHSDAVTPFTIKVVDSGEVNAFALPGGLLYVNRGLILTVENEAELAGVMAHEIAHVTARHGAEQVSKGRLLQYAGIPLLFLGGIGGALIQAAASVAVPLTFLKFSRGAEKEADRLGAQYLWAAGYDPQALLSFFQKLKTRDEDNISPLERLFLSHPPAGKRARKIRKLLCSFPEREESVVNSSEFRRIQKWVGQLTGGRWQSSTDIRPRLKRRGVATGEQRRGGENRPGPPLLRRK